MESLKKNKFLIIFCIILVVISVIVIYFYNQDDENYYEQEEDISLKKYAENEYIPVSISYDQMARIYLQDYVYKLIYNREDAYNTLDAKYRSAKFPTFEDFNEYVNTIMSVKLREMKVDRYAITDKNNYRDFDVYDSSDNLFIFRENGVMQYTVFFDRYTVDMYNIN